MKKLRDILQEFRLKNGEPDMDGDKLEHPFDQTWKKLEKQGMCDSHGGAEYQRIKKEYEKTPVPNEELEKFIHKKANTLPN